ncbi:hypothetical protein D3C72_1327300 [compost metagenome]
MPAEALVQLADRGGAVDHQAAIGLGVDMRVVQALLAFEFADDFFENVFQGDDAQNLAVFVDHHAQAPLLLVEVQQLQLQRRAFRHEVRFVTSGQQRFARQITVVQQVPDLPGVEHRFNLIDVAMEHRQACALVMPQLFDDFFDRVIEVDAVDVTARHQNVVDRNIVQRMNA